jgi:hypothetical protein
MVWQARESMLVFKPSTLSVAARCAQLSSRNVLSIHTWPFAVSYISPPFQLIELTYLAFYSPIFKTLQQKNASSYLTTLWEEDPFKAKWCILARAYSAIRDQVGKSNAPLDRFLALVSPEFGIIAVKDYLQTMLWECEIDVDGVMKLKRTSAPDIASFDHRIQHTSMTDKDVVHLCARRLYITRSNAIAIAGRPGAAEHGLLASAPIIPVAPTAPVAALCTPANNSFLLHAMTNPRRAASDVLGFDVDALLGPAEQSQASTRSSPPPPAPIQWTGCLADIYNPFEGTFDFEAVTNNNDFDVGDISDPRSFDEMFGAVIQDGFMQPISKQS